MLLLDFGSNQFKSRLKEDWCHVAHCKIVVFLLRIKFYLFKELMCVLCWSDELTLEPGRCITASLFLAR